MNPFSRDELGAMQTAQEDAMQDVCELLIRTERAVDEYGMPTVQWVVGQTVACGLSTKSSGENRNAEAPEYDAQLRLPISTDISNIDRVHITERFHQMLNVPLEFALTGRTIRGPSGLLVNLKVIV